MNIPLQAYNIVVYNRSTVRDQPEDQDQVHERDTNFRDD